MPAAKPHISNVIFEMERALERMPTRSSASVRQIRNTSLPVPETRQDIEHYVYDLLAREG
jgi:hypothetical protein